MPSRQASASQCKRRHLSSITGRHRPRMIRRRKLWGPTPAETHSSQALATRHTNTNHTDLGSCAPCPACTCSVPLRQQYPNRTGKWPHTQTPNNSTQLGNGTARQGTSRHVTTRLDTDLSLSSCRSACLFAFFFCRQPFPPPPPHPRDVPESAGANHHHLFPTKKSAVATFSFPSLSPGNSVFYFRPARPLNRALPPDLQLRSNPTRVGTGLCNRAGRPVPVSWGWCVR